jgi:hypothetical protein
MRRDWRAKVATDCAHILGVGNFIMLAFGRPTAVSLGLAAVLAPFTIATALRSAAFFGCSFVSFAIGDRRERAELLVGAIGAVQPPGAGEQYRETMLAVIHAARPDQVRAIAIDLMVAAFRTILDAWVRIPRPLWERARRAVRASTGRPGS